MSKRGLTGARRRIALVDDLEAVRVALADARAGGVPFEQAWELALATIPRSTQHRRLVGECPRVALTATQAAWRRCYDGEPALGGERAVAALWGALSAEPSERAADAASARAA